MSGVCASQLNRKRAIMCGMFAIINIIIALLGAAQAPADRPAVTVRGNTYTPASILSRNMGTAEDQETAFPPHKIIGNIFSAGPGPLTVFRVPPPAGHILIDTTYERNAAVIQKSIE